MISFLAFFSTLMFLTTGCLYFYKFVKNEKDVSISARVLLILTIFINIIYLGSLAYVFKKFPLSSLSEAFDLIAIMLAITYLLIEIYTKNSNTGFLILGLIFLFKLVSLSFASHSSEVNPILTNWYFILHVIPAALGYAAFGLSMIYGILYLSLYREIHQKKFTTFYKRMPPLGTMDKMTRASVKLGFILLTIGIFAGFVLTKQIFSQYFRFDPKIIAIVVIWIVYFSFLVISRVFSWKGKRYAISSIIGFCIVALALLIVQVFLKSFHSFV